MSPPEADRLYTPAEVARLFRVDPKTVTRWAKAGKLAAIRTLGGHRRFKAAEVDALLHGEEPAYCPACLYLPGSPGHQVACGGAA